MTKKMNRIAAQGWHDLKRETEQKEAASKQLAEDMDTLRKFRDYLSSTTIVERLHKP